MEQLKAAIGAKEFKPASSSYSHQQRAVVNTASNSKAENVNNVNVHAAPFLPGGNVTTLNSNNAVAGVDQMNHQAVMDASGLAAIQQQQQHYQFVNNNKAVTQNGLTQQQQLQQHPMMQQQVSGGRKPAVNPAAVPFKPSNTAGAGTYVYDMLIVTYKHYLSLSNQKCY